MRAWLVAFALVALSFAPHAHAACVDEGEHTAREGHFATQPDGEVYEAMADCHWHIAPQPMAADECIVLHFDVVDIDDDWDYFYINSPNVTHVITGWHYDPFDVETESHAVDLAFESSFDPWAEYGVVGRWSVGPCPGDVHPPAVCPDTGVHRARTGSLRTLDDSSHYDVLQTGMRCAWSIEPELAAGECITSELLYVDKEPGDFAAYVVTMDGTTTTDMWVEYYGTDKRLFSARERLEFSLETHAENVFRVRVAGYAVTWSVVPCAEVERLLPLQPHERELLVVDAAEGDLYTPVPWRRSVAHPREMHVHFRHPTLLGPDGCLHVSMLKTMLYSPVFEGEYSREVLTPWWPLMVLGAVNMTLEVGSWGTPAVHYRVATCPDEYATLDAEAAVCAEMNAALVADDWVIKQGRGECCRELARQSVGVNVDAYVHFRCKSGRPLSVFGKFRSPHQSDVVWKAIGQLPTVEHIYLSFATVRPESIPPAAQILGLTNPLGVKVLDLRHTNLTQISMDSWFDGEQLLLPSTVEELTAMNCPRLALTDLDTLSRLRRFTGVDMGQPLRSRLPTSLKDFITRRVRVDHLPLHEGMEDLACERCDLTEFPAQLPSTLRQLALTGNHLGGDRGGAKIHLPQGLTTLRCSTCGLTGDALVLGSPCLIDVLYLRNNDLTALDVSECVFLRDFDVAHNPRLEAIGALPALLHSLILSHTRVPQPTTEALRGVTMLEAESVPTFNQPFEVHALYDHVDVSGSPVGKITMRGLPTFLHIFRAENCELTEFPLPTVEFGNVYSALTTVRLAHNKIRHVPPGALPVTYADVDLSHNEIETLDVSTKNSEPRARLDLSHNRIRRIDGLLAAVVVDLSHNQLTKLPRMHGVQWLDVSHNQLRTAAHPLAVHVSMMDVNSVMLNTNDYGIHGSPVLLDLSHNNLTSVSDTMIFEEVEVLRVNDNALDTFEMPIVATRELDVSHNALTQTEDVVLRMGRDAVLLNAGHNALHRADALVDLPRSLHTLQLEHNAFSGTLPSLAHLSKLATLGLRESGFGVDASTCDDVTAHACVGPALDAVEYRVHDNERMECPIFALAHNPAASLDIDPIEYGTAAVCRCIFGYYGVDGECKRCPANAVCSGEFVVPEQGFWNHIERERRTAPADPSVQRCVSYTTATTCSPDNSLGSVVSAFDTGTVRELPRCSPGHTGRMCAACEEDYFMWGDRCNKCPNGAGVFFLLAASFVIVAAAVTYAYKVKPGTNASLKVLVFFTQTIQLARTTGVQMDDRVASVLDFFSGFMIELPGIECVWRGYSVHEDTYAAMTMPLWACAVVTAVYAVGRARVQDMAAWWDRNARALLLLNFMLFLRVAASVMAPLRCEEDPFIGHRYFAIAPSEVCDHTLIGVSAMMVAVYVLAGPAVLAVVLFRHRHSLDNDRVSARFRFLFSSYRRRYWYWEGVITLRKIGVLAIMASAPRSSVAVPLSVFLLLVLSAVLQDRIKPFAEPTDNAMEYTSLWTLAVLFVLLTASSVPGVRMPLWIGVLVALLQFAFVTGVLLLMLRRHHEQLSRRMPSFLQNKLSFDIVARRTALHTPHHPAHPSS